MYSFLIYASKENKNPYQILLKAASITKNLTHAQGTTICAKLEIFPQIGTGWFYLFPQEVTKRPLISEKVTKELAVLVFGHIFEAFGKNAADFVSQSWAQGGVEKVRNLDGCFSAVIINLKKGSIYIVSDLIGQRTLRYYQDDLHFLVSSQDVPIVATGLCPVEFDLTSACSIVSCGWSLQGKPLLKSVKICDPNAFVVWEKGQLYEHYKPILMSGNRIESSDKKATQDQINSIIENMQKNTRIICYNEPVIKTALTAGMDTRATLAVLLSVLDSTQIETYTSGQPNNFEVEVARSIAKTYKLKHECKHKSDVDKNAFWEHSRLLAFETNGDANSKRISRPVPLYNKDTPITFHGDGGSIYRGPYYPILARKAVLNLTLQDLYKITERKFRRFNELSWKCQSIFKDGLQRLRETVSKYHRISSNPYDVMDLFFIFERTARWGSRVPRITWVLHSFGLYTSPITVKMASQLAAPLAHNHLLHKTIIKRYLPKVYYWLVNERLFMPFVGQSPYCRKIEMAIHKSQKARKKLLVLFGALKNRKGIEEIHSNFFADSIGDAIKEVLLSKDSLAAQLLNHQQLEQMINDHIAHRKSYMDELGFLITIEQWKSLIMEAKAMSAKTDIDYSEVENCSFLTERDKMSDSDMR